MPKQKQKFIKPVFYVLLIALLLFPVAARSFGSVLAVTENELRNQSSALEEKINKNKKKLEHLEGQSASLEQRLGQLREEIARANNEIELTQVKIEELRIELEETKQELERQKDILRTNLRALYKQGNISTVELLASTDSYSDFVNEQEYLERLKLGVQESANKVEELKNEIQKKKEQQEEQLERQEAQRKVLESKRQEQANLLEKTRGEERRYKKIIKDLQAQRAAAEAELLELIRSKSFVSLGTIAAGSLIGRVGSSGFSTGPHLHFAVLSNDNFINPVAQWGTLVHGFQWPLPNQNWKDVTQPFGCVAPYDWYVTKCDNGKSFHGGLDIGGWYGDPVVAAGNGDIVFRGWLGGYGNTVIIDHGNGIYTYYPHLLK